MRRTGDCRCCGAEEDLYGVKREGLSALPIRLAQVEGRKGPGGVNLDELIASNATRFQVKPWVICPRRTERRRLSRRQTAQILEG